MVDQTNSSQQKNGGKIECFFVDQYISMHRPAQKQTFNFTRIKFQCLRPQPSSGGVLTAKFKNSKLTILKSQFVFLKCFCTAFYLRNRKNWHFPGLNEKFLQDLGRTRMRRDRERQGINLLINKYLFQYPLWQASDYERGKQGSDFTYDSFPTTYHFQRLHGLVIVEWRLQRVRPVQAKSR